MEAEYTTSINIHAPLEPMNATAEFKGDILHIYSGNQFATRSGAIAAGAAGIDPKFVLMHQMWLGGGFGRRLDADMMVPAVQAAKAVGKPVKVIYSRQNAGDKISGGFFHASCPRRQASSTPRRCHPHRRHGALDHPPQCAIAHKADDDSRGCSASRTRSLKF